MFFLFTTLMPTQRSFSQGCYTTSTGLYNYSMSNSQILSGGVSGPFYIKVYFHLLRMDNGSGGITLLQLEESKGYLNRAFAPHNIFFVYDCSIDYINSTNYYTGAQIINQYCTLGNTNSHIDGIDIYIGGDDSSPAAIAGNIPSKFFLARGYSNQVPRPNSRSYVIAHEMGHCLGLFHTHHNPAASGSACGGPIIGSACEEYVNGTNSHTCGDYVYDTPADPGMNYGVYQYNCQWYGSGMDANGDPYNPDELNIMSYSIAPCLQYFTQGQGERMRNIIATNSTLQACLTTAPPYLPVSSITTNTTWSANQTINSTIVIEPNTTLTINNGAIINFQNNSRLIVRPGSKLIIDGATLTTTSSSLWQGIKVLGISTQHQYPVGAPTYQGYLELKNGAVIENSVNAISTWDESCMTSSTGGVIVAQNAIFRNNKRDVEFLKYQNFNPSNPTQPRTNLSYFRNCQFVTSANLKGGVNPNSHVTMWNVDGIRFYGCTFENTNTSATSNGVLGNGIYTEDANFIVSGCDWMVTCTPGVCCNQNLNIFRNLNYGIWAKRVAGVTYNYNIDKNSFINCVVGINSEGVDNAIVTRNNLTIGKPRFASFWTTGINLNVGTGYRLEENVISRDASPNTTTIGTWLTNTGMINNQVYKNSFTNLTYGNYAYQRNRGNNSSTGIKDGLAYLCNTHTTIGSYDIYISGTDPVNDGVRQYQGMLNASNTNAVNSAGNNFTRSGFNNESDIANPNTPNFVYYYEGSPSSLNPKYPAYVTNGKVVRTPLIANTCPSAFSGGPGKNNEFEEQSVNNGDLSSEVRQQLISDYGMLDQSLTQYIGLYATLIDGGNTEQLKQDVESAWSTETWQLRQKLLGKSPYLSKEVLTESSNRTDVLPDAIILEILAANPDGLKDEELLKYLSEKVNPLPEWMIEFLRNGSDQTTSRTLLEAAISNTKAHRDQIVTYLVHDMISRRNENQVIDHTELRSWLGAYQSPCGDYQIVDDYFETGNYNAGLAILSTIPVIYKLNKKEQAEFDGLQSLFNVLAGVNLSNRNIFLLEENERSVIQDLADNGEGMAKVRACNLLGFVFGTECDYGFQPPTEIQSFKNGNAPFGKENPLTPSIKVFPNPAKDYVELSYTLPAGALEGTLTITNVKGVAMHTQKLITKYGQVAIDTREWPQGTYLYSLVSNGTSVANSKFVIIN